MTDRDGAHEKTGVPELLLDRPERTLRIVLRAIIEAHPDQARRTDEARVAQAVAILLGRQPRKGAPGKNRDELLSMLAFEYSVEKYYNKRDVSVTSLARRLVEVYPDTAGTEGREAVVRDLVRKFDEFAPLLLEAGAYDSEEPDIYRPIDRILRAFGEAGLKVERRVIPVGYRDRD